jgi:hypothetical protein
VLAVEGRRTRLDTSIGQLAEASEFTHLVHRLACLRGISTLTAFALAVEIGDWSRFTGNTIASFVGLVPSEHSAVAGQTVAEMVERGNFVRHLHQPHRDEPGSRRAVAARDGARGTEPPGAAGCALAMGWTVLLDTSVADRDICRRQRHPC